MHRNAKFETESKVRVGPALHYKINDDLCGFHPATLTLFGSAVSVEFPPHRKFLLLDGSEVSCEEKLFHSLQTQFLSCIASFESTA